jgi:hypothetical protein
VKRKKQQAKTSTTFLLKAGKNQAELRVYYRHVDTAKPAEKPRSGDFCRIRLDFPMFLVHLEHV